jgi:hypothetical protein
MNEIDKNDTIDRMVSTMRTAGEDTKGFDIEYEAL